MLQRSIDCGSRRQLRGVPTAARCSSFRCLRQGQNMFPFIPATRQAAVFTHPTPPHRLRRGFVISNSKNRNAEGRGVLGHDPHSVPNAWLIFFRTFAVAASAFLLVSKSHVQRQPAHDQPAPQCLEVESDAASEYIVGQDWACPTVEVEYSAVDFDDVIHHNSAQLAPLQASVEPVPSGDLQSAVPSSLWKRTVQRVKAVVVSPFRQLDEALTLSDHSIRTRRPVVAVTTTEVTPPAKYAASDIAPAAAAAAAPEDSPATYAWAQDLVPVMQAEATPIPTVQHSPTITTKALFTAGTLLAILALPAAIVAFSTRANKQQKHAGVSKSQPVTVDDPGLPSPWQALLDSVSGVKYYWNPSSNVTTYDRPGSAPSQVDWSVSTQPRDVSVAVGLATVAAVAASHLPTSAPTRTGPTLHGDAEQLPSGTLSATTASAVKPGVSDVDAKAPAQTTPGTPAGTTLTNTPAHLPAQSAATADVHVSNMDGPVPQHDKVAASADEPVPGPRRKGTWAERHGHLLLGLAAARDPDFALQPAPMPHTGVVASHTGAAAKPSSSTGLLFMGDVHSFVDNAAVPGPLPAPLVDEQVGVVVNVAVAEQPAPDRLLSVALHVHPAGQCCTLPSAVMPQPDQEMAADAHTVPAVRVPAMGEREHVTLNITPTAEPDSQRPLAVTLAVSQPQVDSGANPSPAGSAAASQLTSALDARSIPGAQQDAAHALSSMLHSGAQPTPPADKWLSWPSVGRRSWLMSSNKPDQAATVLSEWAAAQESLSKAQLLLSQLEGVVDKGHAAAPVAAAATAAGQMPAAHLTADEQAAMGPSASTVTPGALPMAASLVPTVAVPTPPASAADTTVPGLGWASGLQLASMNLTLPAIGAMVASSYEDLPTGSLRAAAPVSPLPRAAAGPAPLPPAAAAVPSSTDVLQLAAMSVALPAIGIMVARSFEEHAPATSHGTDGQPLVADVEERPTPASQEVAGAAVVGSMADVEVQMAVEVDVELSAKPPVDVDFELAADVLVKLAADVEAELAADMEAELVADVEVEMPAHVEAELAARVAATVDVELSSDIDAELVAEVASEPLGAAAELGSNIEVEMPAHVEAELAAPVAATVDVELSSDIDAELVAEVASEPLGAAAELGTNIEVEMPANVEAELAAPVAATVDVELSKDIDAELVADVAPEPLPVKAELGADIEVELAAEVEAELTAPVAAVVDVELAADIMGSVVPLDAYARLLGADLAIDLAAQHAEITSEQPIPGLLGSVVDLDTYEHSLGADLAVELTAEHAEVVSNPWPLSAAADVLHVPSEEFDADQQELNVDEETHNVEETRRREKQRALDKRQRLREQAMAEMEHLQWVCDTEPDDDEACATLDDFGIWKFADLQDQKALDEEEQYDVTPRMARRYIDDDGDEYEWDEVDGEWYAVGGEDEQYDDEAGDEGFSSEEEQLEDEEQGVYSSWEDEEEEHPEGDGTQVAPEDAVDGPAAAPGLDCEAAAVQSDAARVVSGRITGGTLPHPALQPGTQADTSSEIKVPVEAPAAAATGFVRWDVTVSPPQRTAAPLVTATATKDEIEAPPRAEPSIGDHVRIAAGSYAGQCGRLERLQDGVAGVRLQLPLSPAAGKLRVSLSVVVEVAASDCAVIGRMATGSLDDWRSGGVPAAFPRVPPTAPSRHPSEAGSSVYAEVQKIMGDLMEGQRKELRTDAGTSPARAEAAQKAGTEDTHPVQQEAQKCISVMKQQKLASIASVLRTYSKSEGSQMMRKLRNGRLWLHRHDFHALRHAHNARYQRTLRLLKARGSPLMGRRRRP